MPKLFPKLTWEKFSSSTSCYYTLSMGFIDNEINKIRPQTKDNKTTG